MLLHARKYDSTKKVTLSFSSFSSTSENDDEVPQLMRRRQRVVDLVLVLRSNLEDSNNLSSDQLHPVSEEEIENSYIEDTIANPSSREVEMGPMFKAISQKKSQAPIFSLVPPDGPSCPNLVANP